MLTFIIALVAIVVYLILGVVIVRNIIGEGIAILIGDGFPVWWAYAAIIMWPLTVVYWLWVIYGW